MKNFTFSLLTAAITLVLVGVSDAAPKSAPVAAHNSSFHDYHRMYGKEYSWGYAYNGRHHNHWSSCYFDDRFDCYLYLCPSTSAYYYWCEKDVCYYPTTYCPYKTFCSGRERVCSTCPVYRPTHLPICTYPKNPIVNTIHPIVYHPPVRGKLPIAGNPSHPTSGVGLASNPARGTVSVTHRK